MSKMRRRHLGLSAHRIQKAIILFCTMLLLFPALLQSTEKQVKKVRIPSCNFNRLMMVDENNSPISGYAYDYIQAIAAYARWDVEFVPCDSFSTCMKKLLSGEVDLFYDISYTKERAKIILYPDEPMGHEYYYLYSSDKNQTIVPGNVAALNGKTVGVTSGTIQIDLLKEWCRKKNVNLTVVEYESIPDKEKALLNGKIDLDLEVSMLAKRNFSAVEKIGSSAYYLVTSTKRPDLLEDINTAKTKVLQNDIYYLTRLEERYFSDSVISHQLTEDEKNWIETHQMIRIGYFDNYLPFSTRGQDGQPTGAGVEAIRKIIEELKLNERMKVEFVCFSNQKEGFKALESGNVDMMFPAYVNNSVRKDYRIIQGKRLATLASDLVYLDDNKDGMVRRIGVNRNNLMQFYYSKDSFPNAKIVFYDTTQECLDGVLKGSSDVTFINGLRTDALLKPGKYHTLRKIQAKNDFSVCIAFAEDNIGLMLLMNRGMTMLDPDFINQRTHSYINQLYTYTAMDFLRGHLLLVLIAVAILAAMTMTLLGSHFSNRKLEAKNRQLTEYSETIERQKEHETRLREQLERNQNKLETALKQAQAANRAKTTFLSNMSHDIRTPMNAIIGFTTLAKDHIDDKPSVLEYLETITHSSEHLLSLLNDLLDMSRIESGEMPLREKAESLLDIFLGMQKIVQADIQEKHHQFVIDTSGLQNEFVYCDKLRVNQVLLNLVSNAIKYTGTGGTITLSLTQESAEDEAHGTFIIQVKDNGIGMSKEFAQTVFDPFTREENSTVSGIQGTGLGLAITKKILELMGGTISVTSAKGKGSQFTVRMNLRLAAKPEASPSSTETKEPFSLLKGKKILLVDDSKVNLKLGKLLLQREGMLVETASNGQTAIDTIKEKGMNAYDFIIMDIQMPIMDGYEATAALRKLPGGETLKILALSANAFEEDKEKSLQAGMNGHIAKPLKIEELLKELKRFSV